MQATALLTQFSSSLFTLVRQHGYGFLVAAVLAIAARFLAEHYGPPAMLMALLLGMAFHFLAEEGVCKAGIESSSKQLLRFGVALLGVRISFELVIDLGPRLIAVVIAAVVLTLLFGLAGARILGRDWRFGLLTGGSVAICGASAAMAIAAVLPKDKDSERNLIFTVLGVTLLSTIAMIVYPVVSRMSNFDHELSGVFLGGTIHDVAQVVGAGFSVSEQTGEIATLIKLVRVAMLAPVVLCIACVVRRWAKTAVSGDTGRPPVLPGFVVGFLAFVLLNSLGLIPAFVAHFLSELSRWALLIAIAAVGVKTSLKTIVAVGGWAIALIVAETLFIAMFVLLFMLV